MKKISIFITLLGFLFFSFQGLAWNGVCYSPLEMQALFSPPKNKKPSMKSRIKSLRKSVSALDRSIEDSLDKVDEYTDELADSLNQGKLYATGSDVASQIRDYIELQASEWDCEFVSTSGQSSLFRKYPHALSVLKLAFVSEAYANKSSFGAGLKNGDNRKITNFASEEKDVTVSPKKVPLPPARPEPTAEQLERFRASERNSKSGFGAGLKNVDGSKFPNFASEKEDVTVSPKKVPLPPAKPPEPLVREPAKADAKGLGQNQPLVEQASDWKKDEEANSKSGFGAGLKNVDDNKFTNFAEEDTTETPFDEEDTTETPVQEPAKPPVVKSPKIFSEKDKCKAAGGQWREKSSDCCEKNPEWKSDKYFKEQGEVDEKAFCAAYANPKEKRNCERFIKRVETLLERIGELERKRETLEEELDEVEYESITTVETKTEASGLCFECLEEVRRYSAPTRAQKLGHALNIMGGLGLSYVGVREARKIQNNANERLIWQGLPAQSFPQYSFAGLGLGYQFLQQGIYGLSKPNVSADYTCSPAMHPYGGYGF